MRKALPVLLLLAFVSCSASTRHIATVSVVSAHATLSVVQDMEVQLVCGRPTAPDAPLCIPLEKHHKISELLVQAFTIDGDVASLTRAVQPGQPLPPQVVGLLGSISKLVADILALIPNSPHKAAITARIEGR